MCILRIYQYITVGTYGREVGGKKHEWGLGKKRNKYNNRGHTFKLLIMKCSAHGPGVPIEKHKEWSRSDEKGKGTSYYRMH